MTFLYNKSVTFQMWDYTHLITMLFLACLLLIFFFSRKQIIPYRDKVRVTIGITLLLSRLSLDLWYIGTGHWDVRYALPLELCSIASLACAIMLLTKNKFLFETVYFIGIAGSIQAIITPELMFGFPQYRFIQFFLDHFLLLTGPLLMIWLYDYTITKAAFLKAFITLNSIAAVVFILNFFLNANYMFLRHKPTSASLLDILGPYPLYFITLEGIVLLFFSLLWLPFRRK